MTKIILLQSSNPTNFIDYYEFFKQASYKNIFSRQFLLLPLLYAVRHTIIPSTKAMALPILSFIFFKPFKF
jgi:hypothetical protein